jgi:hypothetical protein
VPAFAVRDHQVGYGDEETVPGRVERVAALVGNQRGADLVVLPELWAHGGFAYEHWATRAEGSTGPLSARSGLPRVLPAPGCTRGRSSSAGPARTNGAGCGTPRF